MATQVTRADKYTQVPRSSETSSDFHVDLDIHPDTLDVLRLTNENAVKRSIRNLLLTNNYERFFDPIMGCNITAMLFEPVGPAIEQQLKTTIETTIRNYESRAAIEDITVKASLDENAYAVSLKFRILNKVEPVSMDFKLYRIR